MSSRSVIIIGGGLGGLFAGALFTKNGYRVTVLEKNAVAGGGLQCFRRNGKIYDTGMHVMGGFEENGNLSKICNYLGILDSLNIQHVDSDCSDEIRYHKSGETFRMASGRENFTARLIEYFPEEADGIRRYVDRIYRITEQLPLFRMRESPEGFLPHSDEFVMPADELIADCVADARLREILAYLNPLYGGVEGHTPAYVHALINVLYINGSSRFVGGSQQLADALCRVISDGGGLVLTGREVSAIDTADGLVSSVHTANGETFSADIYVASIHPDVLLNILPVGTFRRGYVRRVRNVSNTYSAFSLFIDLKPGMFPYIDHTCYYLEDYGSIWHQNSDDRGQWPSGFMYMTPPEPHQGAFADRMLVYCVMDFDRVRRWENTTVGRRGEDYEQWKLSMAHRLLSRLENIYPGFSKAVNHIYTASPLTIRDYYNTKEGAIFGFRKDAKELTVSQLTIRTKLKNLLLTGQNINLHGCCGVPLTAINTVEAVVGLNSVVRAINDAYKKDHPII